MIPYCAFPNTQSAATAVHRFHKDAYTDVTLTARPYNRFEPVNTHWWLTPSTEWPAYHLGKLFFHRLFNADGEALLYTGLYIEKGFGAVVATVDRRIRPQIMRSGWLWPRLVADLESGKIHRAATQVAEQTDLPVEVRIDASYYQDMEPGDPYAQRNQRDALVLIVRDMRLDLVQQHLNVNLLRDLAQSQDLMGFGQRLGSLPDQDWTWINLTLGVSFRMMPLEPGSNPPTDAWDETKLWDRALVPWLSWVR